MDPLLSQEVFEDYGAIKNVTVPLPAETGRLVSYYAIQSIALLLYLFVSAIWVFNGIRYLVLKKRYKEFSITLFYSFTVGLMVVRIY